MLHSRSQPNSTQSVKRNWILRVGISWKEGWKLTQLHVWRDHYREPAWTSSGEGNWGETWNKISGKRKSVNERTRARTWVVERVWGRAKMERWRWRKSGSSRSNTNSRSSYTANNRLCSIIMLIIIPTISSSVWTIFFFFILFSNLAPRSIPRWSWRISWQPPPGPTGY